MSQISATVSTMTTDVTADLNEIVRKEKELTELNRQLKDAEAQAAKDLELQSENPQYVAGSLRKATAADVATFTSRNVVCHGRVGDIICKGCGKVHTLNVQDLAGSDTKAPCIYCPECKKVANKERGKLKRATKRLAGKSLEQVQADIEAKQAAITALKAKLTK